MLKKLTTILFVLCFIMVPSVTFGAMTEYPVGSGNMHISLPNGWYCNTPDTIDPDFLKVSENTESKLSKYLSKNGIQYNLVSKDLKEEINVVLQHTSQTKAMFDFNLLEREILEDRAQTLVNLGEQEEKGVRTTYTDYVVKKINQCVFTIFNGKVESEEEKVDFIQYTTTINGYGVTISYRGQKDVDMEAGAALMEKIVKSFRVTEVIETELKTEVYRQMLTPIAIAGGFILITATLIIRQIRKNRKEAKKCNE